MTDSAGTMPFDALHAFLEKIDIAVRDLRSALEANDMDRLPAALELTNAALESINAYPGGAEKLRADINQFPEDQKEQLLNLLNETSTNHQINGDLIRLAMQRSAAMQSFIAQQAPGATYGSDGGVPGSVGGVLSRKV
jgi:hypothetical protein